MSNIVTPEEFDILLEQFKQFYKLYPGDKRFYNTEMEDLIRGHKDWNKIIPLLVPAIKEQIKSKLDSSLKNKWTPNWKLMKTYLQKNGWEENNMA